MESGRGGGGVHTGREGGRERGREGGRDAGVVQADAAAVTLGLACASISL
jgi:hypothetical protein